MHAWDAARTAAELRTMAISIHERVELVAEQVARGEDPGLRGLTDLLRSTLELRSSVCELLLDAAADDALVGAADVDELRAALTVLTATLSSVTAVQAVARVSQPGPDAGRPRAARRRRSASPSD